jgi:hypothetical protein
MNSYIAALAQTLLIYLILSVSYLGWGRVAIGLIGVNKRTSYFEIVHIWLGWAFSLAILQLLHFFFPITAYLVCPIFAIGVVVAIPQLIDLSRNFRPKYVDLIKLCGILIAGLIVVIWIASRAMLAPEHYDSGLYHFNAIRWINSFPTIPGLGNLHGRLAFNQSFFTYVAALNFYPFFGYGRSIANSFLLILTIATFISWLRPIFKQPSLLVESHPFQYAAVLVAFPILGYLALSPTNLSSPSPDLGSTLLQLTLFLMFAQSIVEWTKGEAPNPDRVVILNILAVTAITIKLSNLVFSAVIMGFSLAYTWKRSPLKQLAMMRIMLPNLPILLIWTIQGYIGSGVPLYPSTIGYISALDWAIPIDRIKDEANWVYSWARQPGVHWRKVLANWDWFAPWLQRISQEFKIVYPLLLSTAFGILTAIVHRFARLKNAWSQLNWTILAPVLFGLIYWFITAPDPRFANALFSCLSLSTTLLLLTAIQPLVQKYVFVAIICVGTIVANVHSFDEIVKHQRDFQKISAAGWYPVKTVPLVKKTTVSGLVVSIPAKDDRTWDSPLPAAPNFNPSLRLRVPGQLSSGFTVAKP